MSAGGLDAVPPKQIAIRTLLGVAVVLAGCGGSGPSTSPSTASPSASAPPRLEIVTLPASAEKHLQDLIDFVLGGETVKDSLGAFWGQTFPQIASGGATYHDPSGVIKAYLPGETPGSGCQVPAELAVGNAFYCSRDESIWYDVNLLRTLFRDVGDTSPVAVLAHEFGHHVQHLAGTPSQSIQKELQADCFEGVYLAHLSSTGHFEEGDLQEAIISSLQFGDKEGTPNWFDPGVHGSSGKRLQAMGTGFDTADPSYCLDYNRWAEVPPLDLGGGRAVLPPP